jgi:hypothetical protein
VNKSRLKLDALVNFALGILLLLVIPFPEQITAFLGVPKIAQAFYPSLFGAVLCGIGMALWLESSREHPQQLVGLGLGGAITINLCGGLLLVGWLLFGNLQLPLRGLVFLWIIAVSLVSMSAIEGIASRRK